MYLSTIKREYEKNNEGRLLILTVCLLKIFYCLDGEEENKMERIWETEEEVRYVEGVDNCDYIYLWSDWVKLYTLETILRRGKFHFRYVQAIYSEFVLLIDQ